MHFRARAAALCAAAVSVVALLPAAAQAQTQTLADSTHVDQLQWPKVVDNRTPNVPNVISPGACDPGTGAKTFTFASAGDGDVMFRPGTYREEGSFTVAYVDGVLRVTDFDSTFSSSSELATVTGERHLRESKIADTVVFCGGTTPETRQISVWVPYVHTVNEITYSTGVEAIDRGWALVSMHSFLPNGGSYFSKFSSDQDDDGHWYGHDNCNRTYNPDQADGDGDRIGDACDSDLDNDFRSNAADNCPSVPNFDQADADGDGIGDVCDPQNDRQDADGDGVVDEADNCVAVPNPDQADTGGSSLGDACEDRDGDGVGDLVDNCVDDANGAQANLDGDASGDACDPDDDGDSVADVQDNCPVVANPVQRDSDADGKGDLCDGTFDSNEGFAGGGGKLPGAVHVSVALHSHGGALHGSGQLADGGTTVRLLDVTGLRSDGDRVVAVGTASANGDAPMGYRLEIVDSANTFELELGDRRWAGPLINGNLVVR